VPFISQISRPWRHRENKEPRIFEMLCYYNALLSPASKNAKIKGAKIKGFTVVEILPRYNVPFPTKKLFDAAKCTEYR